MHGFIISAVDSHLNYLISSEEPFHYCHCLFIHPTIEINTLKGLVKSLTERISILEALLFLESQSKTPRVTRQKHDMDAVLTILSNVDSALSRSSIQDLYCLGKFNISNPKPRPLLVKLLRTFDVTSILSKRSLAPKDIIIKPYLTREERAIESLCMQTRWELAKKGTNKKCVKLKGSNKPFGRIDRSPM